jgi:hypothetical protein
MDLHTIAFGVHLLALAVAACGVVIADKIGFSWIRGKVRTLSPRTLHILHETLSYSLAALILSGLYLFWPMREYLLQQNLFLLKMLFVAVLVINSVVIDRLMLVATKVPFTAISGKGKVVLFISGAISFACWAGAALAALIVFGL